MANNPEDLSQSVPTAAQLFSLLGIFRKVVQLNPGDVIRRNPISKFAGLSQTFTTDELLSVIFNAFNSAFQSNLPENLKLLDPSGMKVRLCQVGTNPIEGRLQLALEFYPGEYEIIEILSKEDSSQLPTTLNLHEFLATFNQLGDNRYWQGLIPHVQGLPAEVLQLGSPRWEKGIIRLNLKFYPATAEVCEMQSPLDEIRKLMAETS